MPLKFEANYKTKNLTEKVIAKDIVGNETQKTITVNNIIPIRIKEGSGIVIENDIIKNIQPKTTYYKLMENLETRQNISIKEGETKLTENSIIKTGQKLIVNDTTYTLIVLGDTICIDYKRQVRYKIIVFIVIKEKDNFELNNVITREILIYTRTKQ